MDTSGNHLPQPSTSLYHRAKAFFSDYQTHLYSDAPPSEHEKLEAPHRRLSYRAFFIVVIGIGIPLWWFTTTPYRATLPHFDESTIRQLNKTVASLQQHAGHGDEDPHDVWSRTPLSPRYQIHVIFLHRSDHPAQGDSAAEMVGISPLLSHLQTRLRQYSSALKRSGVQLGFTSEHLFDFDNDLIRRGGIIERGEFLADTNKVALFTSAIDRLSTPPTGNEPLLKLVAVLNFNASSTYRVIASYSGLCIASWGGVVVLEPESDPDKMSAVTLSILSTLMGVSKSQNSSQRVGRLEAELFAHSRRLLAQNLLQTVHLISSLNELGEKIEDLVISDEVAQLAQEASANFHIVLRAFSKEGRIDNIASANGRMFANAASTHPSLIGYLNFPSDQKYGIYLPLFAPLLVPIIQPAASLLKFALTYRAWRSRNENKEKLK